MRKIFTPYNPPQLLELSPCGESITVQGIVTSLSVILNGGDDNNLKTLELGYSEEVRDLYPEMFGRPTKYEMDYLQKEYPSEPGGPSDMPPENSDPMPPTDSSSTITEKEVEK